VAGSRLIISECSIVSNSALIADRYEGRQN
jgi:hypothetical protein